MKYPFARFTMLVFFWMALSATAAVVVGDIAIFLRDVSDVFPIAAGFWGYHIIATSRPAEGRE